jgi:hypothetical protein
MDASEITEHIIDHIAVNYEDFHNDEVQQILVHFKESELQPHLDSSAYSLEEYGEIEFYLPQRVKTVSFHAVSEKVLEPIAEYVNDCCPTVESTAYARKVLLDLTTFDQSGTDSLIRLYLTETLSDNRLKEAVLALYRSMRGYHEAWDISKTIVFFNQQTHSIELQLTGEVENPAHMDVFSDSLSEYYSLHTKYERQDSTEFHPIDQYLISTDLSPTVLTTLRCLEQRVLEQLGQQYTEYSDVYFQEVGYKDGSVKRKYTVEQSM